MIKRTNIHKRVFAAAIAGVTLLGSVLVHPIPAQASTYWPDEIEINSPCAVAMEVNTGTVLFEKNSHEVHYPASITKILTTLLGVENCELDETVVFSQDAVYKNEGDTSHISRDVGEEMTVEQTLYAVMLESANECAYAIAEHVGQKKGGDYRTFIDMMNEKAKSLGCTDTHFNNSNGLPDEEHYTSAYDMGLISCAAYRNEAFREITGTKTYQIPPTNKHSDVTYLSNHHNILHYHDTSKYVNQYCTGGKTGFTRVANSTLVTYAEKDGMTIAVVVMNAASPNHYLDTNKIINYCFNNFSVYSIADNEKSIQTGATKDTGLLNSNTSFVTLNDQAYIILPNSVDFSDATFERDDNPKEGSVVSLKYTYAGRDVGSVEIVTTGVSVDKSYFDNAKSLGDNVNIVRVKPIYVVIAVFLIILLIVALYYAKKFYDDYYIIKHRRKYHKEQKERFKEVKIRNKRTRKKDRMFK